MGAAKKLLDKKVLKDLVPLNALSAVHLDEISRKAVIETIRSGQYVFKAGDRDYQSVYVMEGKVELVDEGRNVVGSVIGGSEAAHHPLAHKQPRQLSARASGSVTVARVDSSLLDVLLTWDESSGYDVVEIGAEEDGDWMTRMLQSQAFLQLPPSNIHQLLMRLEPVNVRAGDVVVRQDEEGDYFYIVKSGRIAVSRKASTRSKEVLLAELGEGACFGEEALVSSTRRNATVTMLTDGSLMRLSKDDFNELLRAPLVHELDYPQAKAFADKGAEWLDVRLPGEFNNQHIRDSRNFPLSALREQADALDTDKQYIVCCDTGRRSASGAFILSQRGLDVYTLKNGLMDVPGGAMEGIPEQPEKKVPNQDAEIIPFENDRDTHKKEMPAQRQNNDEADRLNEQLKVSEAARNTLHTEVRTLHQRIESLGNSVRDSEARHGDLIQQLEDAQQARESFAETGDQLEKQRAQLVSELERVREDYQQLGQRTSAVAGERDAISRDLEKAHSERDALQARLDSQQGEVSEQVHALQTQIESLNHELETEAARRSESEATLASVQKAVSDAADREAELIARQSALEQQANEQNEQLQEDFQAEKAVLEQQLRVQQDSIGEYEQKLVAQSGEYALLVGKLADAEEQLTRSQATEHSLNESLEAAQQRADETEQRIQAELQQEHDALSAEITDLRKSLAEQDQLAEQLQAREQALAEAEKYREEAQQQLALREREFESSLGSAHKAMARAQTDVENLKREQQRLLDRLRKMEEARDRDRHDHEAEVHRLHKEMQSVADGSAKGLADELEALQAQLNESARLRDDLEVRLGERSAQFEDAQARNEQFEQQLKLAQQSAREAEQQLLDANRLANDEMEIRLNTESGIQQGLREALEASERDRNSHQETITIIHQELEELREAYQQTSQALENREDAVGSLDAVQARLEAVQTERDELVSSAEAMKRELDQLRAEAEVHRGLEGMSPEEEADAAESEAMQQAKQNVEIAVRLRTQAEERLERLHQETETQLESLHQEVEQLKVQLSRASEAAAPVMVEGVIPSLDDNDPHAANPMLQDMPEAEEDNAPVSAVLLDEETPAPPPPVSVQTSTSGLVKGLLAGLIVGAIAGAGLFWWQAELSQSGSSLPATGVQHVTSAGAVDRETDNVPAEATDKKETAVAAPVADSTATQETVKQAETVVVVPEETAPAIEKPVEKKPPVTPTIEMRVQDEPIIATPEPEPELEAEPVPDVPPLSTNVPDTFPLTRGMPDVPRSTVAATNKIEASETVADAETTPEIMEKPVIEQPAGRFRDRLSDGGSGPAMVRFRADHFLMGSSDVSPQFDERPQHDVRLGAFAIATHETTFDEYDAFARATGRRLPDDKGWGRAQRPVINVSWEDAQAYVQWLSAQTGVRYRLPTEAEWEFVARSGTMTRFWWGEDVSKNQANCFDCGNADGGKQTSRTGVFSASPWGAYDMAGNVREWVEDCYTPNYSRAPQDGHAVDTGGCTERVMRGGAYSSPSVQLRSASRDRIDAQSRLDNLGFRVARDD